MDLSENSIKLINILCSDSEKLNHFVSLFKKEEAFEYCVSLVPEFTQEEFDVLKEALCSKKETLSDDETGEINGGTLIDDLEYVSKGIKEGQQKAEPIRKSLSIASDIVNVFKAFKKK